MRVRLFAVIILTAPARASLLDDAVRAFGGYERAEKDQPRPQRDQPRKDELKNLAASSAKLKKAGSKQKKRLRKPGGVCGATTKGGNATTSYCRQFSAFHKTGAGPRGRRGAVATPSRRRRGRAPDLARSDRDRSRSLVRRSRAGAVQAFRGDESRRRRDRDADIPRRRVARAAAARRRRSPPASKHVVEGCRRSGTDAGPSRRAGVWLTRDVARLTCEMFGVDDPSGIETVRPVALCLERTTPRVLSKLIEHGRRARSRAGRFGPLRRRGPALGRLVQGEGRGPRVPAEEEREEREGGDAGN